MQTLKVFISIIGLLFNTSFSFASDVQLTEQEKISLDKLGVSRDELGQMAQLGDFSKLENKLEEVEIDKKNWASKAQDKIDKLKAEVKEAKTGFENEAQAVQRDMEEGAEGIAKGYAASTVSLIMLAVFAPSVVMACRTKPSALAYAATAAVYLTRELMNSRKFKASALSEIKYVEMKLDKSKSLDSNIQTAKKGLNMQFEFIQSYKNIIDKGLKSLEDKAENAKLASVGFALASAMALAETYAFDAGSCVKVGEAKPEIKSKIYTWIDFLFPYAYAQESKDAQLKVKKKMLVKDLKDNKLADLASDSDKILAVLVGGGSIAAAAFIPSYAKILSSIVSNGLGRSIVFAAHGLIAFSVYQSFSSASEKLMGRSQQLQKLLDQAKNAGEKGLDSLSSRLNSKEIRSTLKDLGVDKSAGEMSPDEIEGLIRGIDTENIKEELEENIPEDLPETSSFEQLKQLIWPEVYAQSRGAGIVLRCYIPKRCPPPRFPVLRQKAPEQFSVFASNFQEYSHEVYADNLGESSSGRRFLLKGRSLVLDLQKNLYRKALERRPSLIKETPTPSFEQQVENQVQQIISEIEGSERLPKSQIVAKRREKDQTSGPETNEGGTSAQEITTEDVPESDPSQISAVDHAVLTGLIERLKYSKEKLNSSNYQIKAIHSKKVDLFEAIHRRYQLIFQSQ